VHRLVGGLRLQHRASALPCLLDLGRTLAASALPRGLLANWPTATTTATEIPPFGRCWNVEYFGKNTSLVVASFSSLFFVVFCLPVALLWLLWNTAAPPPA